MEPCSTCGEVHQRDGVPTCIGHRNGDGRFCGKYPVDGAKVCGTHGGSAPQVRAAARQRVEVAAQRQLCSRLGVIIETDPGTALIELVGEAAGNVEYFRQLVAALPDHPVDDTLTVDEDGSHWTRGDPGIYGRTYHQSGLPTGEAKPHVLVTMYNEERDRLEKYSTDALKAGVEERSLRLREADARDLFAGIGKAVAAAELTPQQAERLRSELADYFRQLQRSRLPG